MRISRPVGLFLAVGLALASPSVPSARADQILQLYNTTLTTYTPSGATAVQSIRPMAIQRGVGIDGSARAGGAYPWAFAGNPFGDAMSPVYRIGDVNLATGAYSPTDVDLSLPAPGGSRLVFGRTFNGRQETSTPAHRNSNAMMGFNWHQSCEPEIVLDGSNLYIVYGADRYIEFTQVTPEGEGVSGVDYFQARNGAAGVVVHSYSTAEDPPPDSFAYYDQQGNVTYFVGNNAATSPASYQFWKSVDPAGNTAYVGDASSLATAISGGYDAGGRITKMYDGATADGRRYTLSYTTVGGVPRLTQIKAEIKNSGVWASSTDVTTVGTVTYDFYTADTSGKGLTGDLKLVTINTPLTDAGVSADRKKYYRYYTTSWSNTTGGRGEPHQVKMVLGNEGYRADDWLDSNLTNDDPLSASDADLMPYSDAYIEYADTGGSTPYRVSSCFFNGECGCSGGSNGTYTITYSDNGGFSPTAGYDVDWKNRAVVLQPDGNYCSYFFDEVAQPLSKIVTNADPTGSPTKKWITGVTRDSAGCVTYIHTPANASGYTNSTGVITYSNSVGLVKYFERVSSTDMVEFPQSVMHQQGYSDGMVVPTPYYDTRTTYGQRDLSMASGISDTRPVVATRRVYPVETSTYSTSGSYNETSYTDAWWSATSTNVLYITLKQLTTTNPVVSTGNNGSNAATTTDRFIRKDGTTAFMLAADGIYDYAQYTDGQMTKQVRDVITTDSFPSGDDPNTDFGITETGSGCDRTTTFRYLASDGSSPSEDPKEAFVYQNAGLGGYGRSSYIDDVVIRGSDDTGWVNLSDGIGDFNYYCQDNIRHDVVAMLYSDGELLESEQYTSNGRPEGDPVGDVNGDFVYDATDDALITGVYAVTKDTNLDGVINASDVTWASHPTGTYQALGLDVLSSAGVMNRKGYCGYESDPVTGLDAVRHRWLELEQGRWLSRDPAGYRRDVSLYVYASNSPFVLKDPMGLLAVSCSGSCRPPSQDPRDPGNCGAQPTKDDCSNCCDYWFPGMGPKNEACHEVCYMRFPPPLPKPGTFDGYSLQDCVNSLHGPLDCKGAFMWQDACEICCERATTNAQLCVNQACGDALAACGTSLDCQDMVQSACDSARNSVRFWHDTCIAGCGQRQAGN